MKRGTRVIVVNSDHSGVSKDDVGVVEARKGKGYVVWFPATRYVDLFGGGSKRRAASVYMGTKQIRRVNQKDITDFKKWNPTPDPRQNQYLEHLQSLELPPKESGDTKNK